MSDITVKFNCNVNFETVRSLVETFLAEQDIEVPDGMVFRLSSKGATFGAPRKPRAATTADPATVAGEVINNG